MKSLLLLCIAFFSLQLNAQKLEYASALIPKELTDNANAVVRYNEENYTVNSQNSLSAKVTTVITILNEYGLRNLNTQLYYSPTTRISRVEARVYDKMGYQLKVFKKKDFRDVSLADGFSVFNDDRMLYLDYTPIAYPFTFVMESEYHTSNTAQMPRWSALSGYFVSTEKDVVRISYPDGLGFGFKEVNFDPKFDIARQQETGTLTYTARNIAALKREEGSPEFHKMSPMVCFRLDKFSLEGVDGHASDWKEFGKWYHDRLLSGTDELPEETQAKVRELIGQEKDPIKIARKLYQYVQDRTRYVSIQVGIGGYKPMKAADVDRLGYGDCKALSNYMRALLAVADIPSYFTLVYAGDDSRRGLMRDFVSPQGNHAILAMPNGDDYIWLECTSQVNPFGFQGMFTDGREVLVIKPEGGEITKTRTFAEQHNSRLASGNFAIAEDSGITGAVVTRSKGAAYDAVYRNERLSPKDKEKFYKNSYANISNLKLDKIEFRNDREKVEFTEAIQLSAPAYGNVSTGRIMFAVNALNPYSETPKRYRNRQNPFEVERGFFEQDEIAISIPDGFAVEALPSDASLKTKFGEYECKIVKQDDKNILYKRTFLMKDGSYSSAEYDEYRQFCEQVARFDSAKAVIYKKG
ncbi:transglutaminase-like domain-containing protein [Flavobacterium selenitireducens]|uniref:transglutaminase-like domain-containing protein n=1 Tax=Flavobacterium selenitireducens TaxID=2722704 RepID=UPI001CC2F774|nr:transglutaminase family protein [Flavobacterium selenitireducens]